MRTEVELRYALTRLIASYQDNPSARPLIEVNIATILWALEELWIEFYVDGEVTMVEVDTQHPINAPIPPSRQEKQWWRITVGGGYGSFDMLATEAEAEQRRKDKARWEHAAAYKELLTPEEIALKEDKGGSN